MWTDPVVEATRQARAEIVAPFHDDIHSFFEYIRELERKNGEPTITLEPNPPDILAVQHASR